MSGLQRVAQDPQRGLQRRHQRVGGVLSHGGRGVGELAGERGEASRGIRALALLVAGGLGEGRCRSPDRFDGLLVRRRVERRGGVQHRADSLGRLADDLQLGILVGRHQGRQRRHAGDVGKFAQLLADEIGRGEVGLQHVDRLRVGVGVLHQRQQRRDRLALLIVEVQRVEVEAEIPQQRRAGDRHRQRADDDHVAVALDEVVDGGEELVADGLRLGRRPDQGQHRRQHGDRAGEGDQHAGAGDLAEVGDAFVGRRQEGVEAGHRGQGGEGQRPPDLGRADVQSVEEVGVIVALGLEADRELDPEIDADADEQHGEGDRQHVELVDQQEPGREGGDEADQHRHQDGADELERLHGRIDDQDHRDDHEQAR